jgi:hypothetical protein
MTRVLSTPATPGRANPLEALSFTRGEAPGVSVTVSLTVHSKSPQPRGVASDFLVEAPGVEIGVPNVRLCSSLSLSCPCWREFGAFCHSLNGG